MKKKSKPEIRFKGFEEDWDKVVLAELGDFKSNGVDKKISPKEIPVNLLNYLDVYNSRIINSSNCNQLMHVTAKPNQLIENNVLANDVFFTPSSETPEDIGKVMAIEEDLPNTVYSYHLIRFRPKSNVLYSIYPNYGFACDLVRKQLILSAQGVQRYVINKPSFEQITIFLPKYDEQKQIGNLFKNLDSLITDHQQKHTKLKSLKKAMLDKMFPKQGQLVPEIRFKGFEGEWKLFAFKDIADLKRGLTYSPSNVTNNSGVKVLRSSNINEGKFVQREDDVFVKKEAINISFANEQDILITAANGSSRLVGKHALVSKLNCKAVHGGFMLLASAKHSFFLNAYMYTEWYNKFVNQFTAGGSGSIGNLNKIDLEQQMVLVPSEDEQIIIGNYFKNFDELIDNHKIQITKLQNIKKAFLAKMFI